MSKLVLPKTYLLGFPILDQEELNEYLKDTGNLDFLESMQAAKEKGISEGEILCSFYAKLCYKSLTLGKNKNVTKIRDIEENLINCLAQGHGSIFDHVQINFVTTNCSRVFTHELVRHRVGSAFSQTSGRYVRGDDVDIVFDPILEPVRIEAILLQNLIEIHYRRMVEKLELEEIKDFSKKKKITSALRRFLPNGQSNEIGFSLNIRSLRHTIQMRTAGAAEWEIRLVFNQVYKKLKKKFPLFFSDAKERIVDDLVEVYGMKMQPYDKTE